MNNFLILPALFALLYACPASAQTNTFPATGNVGIGTTSPSQTLQLYSTSDYEPQIFLTNVDNTGGSAPYGIFQKARSGPGNVQSGDGLGTFLFEGYYNSAFQQAAYFNAVVDAAPSGSTVPAAIAFANGSAETIRFSSNNRVGIGSTAPANTLDIGNSGGIHITSGVPSSTTNALYNNSGALGWNGALEISSAGHLQCGGSNCANSTGSATLNYCPYKGNVKTTASQGNYVIPSACLSATLTSMYVGGVGSTSVAASTLYYIYLWNTSGTWVLDAETGGHATDSPTGIEIKSGDNTKTLLGIIHTDANKHVMTGGDTHVAGDTNTVATWDNRIPTNTQCGFTAQRQVSSSSLTEVNSENRCLFMSWGDAAQVSSQQMLYPPSGASDFVSSVLAIDGTSNYVTYGYMFLNVNTGTAPYTLALPPASFTPSEGYHYTELLGSSENAVTITYPSTVSVTTVFTIQ
jgi:hypothetical protein